MMLEPINLPLLPLLEGTLDTPAMRPTASEGGADRLAPYRPQLRSDLQWVTERPVDERLALRAAAVANLRQGPFQVEPGLDEDLTLPEGFNPRTRAWARSLLQIQPELREQGAVAIIAAVMRHINDGFVYTLTPGTYGDESGRHAIDEFWLDRRQGFCEHYATATVFILRTLGIPARIVTGYQGADIEPQDGWTIVRQANAHAWLEAWAPDQGWFRVDPTAAVAPERVREGRTLRPARGLVAGALATIDPALLPTLRRFAERIEHRWNRWVVQYSRGQQYELLKQLGVSQPDWGHLAYALLALLCTVSIGGAAWAWWDRNRRDPWERLQARVRERLRRLGIVAGVHEAPRSLALRVRAELGTSGEALAQALLELDRQRYAQRSRPHPDPLWWRRFRLAAGAVRNP
jgi:protein-glutamine gamma-glutamyltransferase